MRVSVIDRPTQPHAYRAFNVTVAVDGRRATIRPHGEIDVATVPAVEEHADALWADGAEELVLDLAAVTFFDSSGLRLLIRLHARADQHADRAVVIAACSPAVLRILELTRFADRFQPAASAA